MSAINSLLEKIDNAKALDFGTIFNQSIELFKKVWVQGLVMLLLTFALMIPFYLIIYLPLLAIGIINPEMMQNGEELNILLMIPFMIMILAFAFFAMVIGFGLKASFYRICKFKDFGELTSDDYFYYLKRPYLGKVINLSLISFGITLLAVLLCIVPVFYVIVPVTLMNVIFAFNPDLSSSEIVKAGFRLGNKKWLITFGLIIIAGFMAQIVGMIMCLIGVLVTTSFAYLPMYFIYKESVGFDFKEEISSIGDTNN